MSAVPDRSVLAPVVFDLGGLVLVDELERACTLLFDLRDKYGVPALFAAMYALGAGAVQAGLGVRQAEPVVLGVDSDIDIDQVSPGTRAASRFLVACGNSDPTMAWALFNGLPDTSAVGEFVAVYMRETQRLLTAVCGDQS